mmetsp:Transcript_20804/g.57787  ORF Transcript_20804/g.57787 Transcript_20804/m.57787 type:complete len:127 (-) Transcript_20804:74-454(-)
MQRRASTNKSWNSFSLDWICWAVREDDDDEEESPEKNRLGPTPILGLTLTLAVERNHCGVFHPASVPIDRVAPVAHCAVAVVLLVAAAANERWDGRLRSSSVRVAVREEKQKRMVELEVELQWSYR